MPVKTNNTTFRRSFKIKILYIVLFSQYDSYPSIPIAKIAVSFIGDGSYFLYLFSRNQIAKYIIIKKGAVLQLFPYFFILDNFGNFLYLLHQFLLFHEPPWAHLKLNHLFYPDFLHKHLLHYHHYLLLQRSHFLS